MANKERGEVTFQAAGETHTARLGTNELCDLEERLDGDLQTIFARFDSGGGGKVSDLRTIFSVMTGLTDVEAVGALMDALGFDEVGRIISEVVTLAFPEVKPGGKKKLKAAGGSTGRR